MEAASPGGYLYLTTSGEWGALMSGGHYCHQLAVQLVPSVQLSEWERERETNQVNYSDYDAR